MTKFQDADYLKSTQYAGADKLAARIRLHERFNVSAESQQRWTFHRIIAGTPANATVLEVGAGRGDLWKQNADRIPLGWQITLTDLSAGMLADGKVHLGTELAGRFAFEVADVQALPYPDAHFDAVIANYMLYHVPDLAKAIAEIRRVLKPDGVLFAMTNGDQHLRELEAIIETLQQGDAESEIGLMGDVRKAFRLQTGADALRQQFSQVTREDFDSHLHVTELPPLMDYIASVMDDPAARMDTPQAQALWQTLEQQIAQDGAIHITKETGLFTARPVRQSDEVS